MTDYVKYWDEVISRWADDDGVVPEPEECWFVPGSTLHRELMPEPYWGDIDNNSVVVLNYNPAGIESAIITDTCHFINKDDPSTVCGLMSSGYSDIARSFPLLDEFPLKYSGVDWWQKRVRWVKSFVPDSNRKPFAMELCAWHSKTWTGWKYNRKCSAINDYISDRFGPWLRRALRGSETHLILCVGNEFVDHVFHRVWPNIEDITMQVLDNPQPVEGNARRYRVFRIPGEGNIICTSARGSNGIPSESVFGEIEKEIFRKISTNQ